MINKIQEDQIKDFAVRKKMKVVDVKKLLNQNV